MFRNITNNNRFVTIDFIKLFAAFLVIVGHCIINYVNGATNTPLYNFIWLTQMTLFMFASGFTNVSTEKVSSFSKYLIRILKHFLTLVVPCISYLLLTSLINKQNFVDGIVAFYHSPESNLWFLWVLFIISIVFEFGLYLSTKIDLKIKKFIPVIISLFVMLIIGISFILFKDSFDFSILSLKLIAYYIPFYCIGYLTRLFFESNFSKKRIVKNLYNVAIVCFTVILLFECFYFKSIFGFNDSSLKYVFIRFIGSISSIFVCLYIFDFLSKFKFIQNISKFGCFSLQSYYFHIIFLRYLNFSSDSVAMQWLIAFSVCILLVALVAVTLSAIYFVPYFHLLLFGKSFSIYKFEKRLPKIFHNNIRLKTVVDDKINE